VHSLTFRLHVHNTALSKPKIDSFDVDAAVHTCGQAALVSGGSSDPFQMNSPWQQYSAYSIKVTNNVIRDVWGAGLSVFGGYSILMAHNTLHR
jgi:hypothetical protein